jgi:uncharacterized protein
VDPHTASYVIFIVALAVGVTVMYLGLLLLLWRFQERLVFQPPKVSSQTLAVGRTVSFTSTDGIELFAHVVGEYAPGTPVVLAFHGNADMARWLVPWAGQLSSVTRLCVVIPEYRGYDGLAGQPSYLGTSRDAQAALRYVREVMAVPSHDVVYFGHSLGSAVAAELAAIEPPRSLIVQSPFSSANDMSRRYFFSAPSFVLGRISRIHFDTIARVKSLSSPVWVAHGKRDVIVPVRMGRAVFEAAAVKGELLILLKAGHNDVAEVGADEYVDWFARAVGDPRARRVTPDAPTGIRSAP